MTSSKLVLRRPTAAIIAGVVLVVGFSFGFIAGYFGKRGQSTSSAEEADAEALRGGLSPTAEKLMYNIEPDSIRQFHRYLTSKPHLAGTDGEREAAEWIYDQWRSHGLSSVRMVPYRVLLSYPDPSDPSKITLFDRQTPVYQTQLVEKILRPEQNQSNVVPPYNIYSPPGTVTGELVYVNYGRVDDFQLLRTSLGVDVNGKLCIARYGRIFRADKVEQAEKAGCKGMILYSDPADYAVDGITSVYPDSWWLPGTGVQRGTIKKSDGGLGDPLTPMYPATESAFRLNESEALLPRIPVHPIGYDDARVLLGNLSGPTAPANWQGKLNITYHLGGSFSDSNLRVEMHVSNKHQLATTRNVVGFIEGQVEPDRYVILGNHYDDWVFGAVDPNSGMASLMEVVKAFGLLMKQGWRPRRTMIFCAWGAEEPGIIGSREWVENFGHIISDRTVAYLNVDSSLQGRHALRARALPLLHQLIYSVTKLIPNPDPEERKVGHETVYDTWLERLPNKEKTRPKITLLGSGSDFAPFVGSVGVTAMDIRYQFDESYNISSYPLYHSVYETSHMFETYIDPTFEYSVSVCRLWAEVARRLADHTLIPFGVVDYSKAVEGYLKQLEAGYETLITERGLGTALGYLRAAVDKFKTAALSFQSRLGDADKSDVLRVRQLNDQMIQLERAFIDYTGLPGRPAIRHVLFAPSIHNSYAGTTFPGLVDSLFGLTSSSPEADWRKVEKQFSVVTFHIEAAAASLQEPTLFTS